MFRLHKKTEHMLVARELEREFKDLNKFDKSSLRVWEKQTSTRTDRVGTIRVVNDIPALRPVELEKNRRRSLNPNTFEQRAGPKTTRNVEGATAKINIFDKNNDTKVAKADALRTVTGNNEDRALVVSAGESSDAGSSF